MKKTTGIFGQINRIVQILNTNKFFAGILMLFLNLGSKFITVKFSKTQEALIKNTIGRQVLIFVMAFVATRDIYLSLGITAFFVILADHLFHEESPICIIPKRFHELKNIIDANNDNEIDDEEINNAINILKKAKKKKEYKAKEEAYQTFINNAI
jgi:hypothetical protein